jgi:Sulfotransferase domain
MLPNFLIIGATKCATTSLWGLLRKHPQVFLCLPKEPQFFSRPDCFARGLAWYESLFAHAGDARAIGEASANYTNGLFAQLASQRIAQMLPHARLIYCVRHPLQRIESAWIHVRARQYTPAERAFGVEPVPSDFLRALKQSTVGQDLVASSLYWKQLGFFRRFFPDERIHVVFFADFIADQPSAVRECLRFLQVDPALMPAFTPLHLNGSWHKQEPSRLDEALRRLPLLRSLAPRLPPRLRSRPARKPIWRRGAYDYVVGLLRPDAARFLEYCGRPASFWELG